MKGVPGSALPAAVALAIMVFWGATPVATRLAVVEIDPIALALLRAVIGGTAGLAVALVFGVPRPRGPRAIGLVLVAGFTGFVAFPILYNIGQQQTSALHGALILAALPVLTGCYAAVLERTWPGRRWLIGCAIALAGEGLLITARGPASAGAASLRGDLIIAVSALIVSFGYVVGARATQLGTSSLGTTLWGIGASAIMVLPLVPFALDTEALAGAGIVPWGAAVYLALVTSILGYVGWYWALARGGIQRIALVQFLQPVSGVVLAVAVLGERPSALVGLAGFVILGGIVVAQRR